MRPLYLELQAFGPFVEKQTVDLDRLSANRIFLITGETGSGKTSIIDAMTIALYGGGSGITVQKSAEKMGRNSLDEWRCTKAAPEVATYVSFTFSERGKVYRFTRRYEKRRINFSSVFEAGEVDASGNVIPFFSNPKEQDLNRKAEELIGLTKEQFRQVVLLPQGQFETFLTASSRDKEDILKSIFGAKQWDSYAERFYRNADATKKAVDGLKTGIDNSLTEEGLTSLDELDGRIAELKAEREAVLNEHTEFDGENRQKLLNRDIELAERFRQLHELEKRIEELDALKDSIDEARSAFEDAEQAESVRDVIQEYEKAHAEYSSRASQLETLQKRYPAALKKRDDALSAKEEHEKTSREDELTRRIGVYEEKIRVYEDMEPLETALNEACSEYEKAETAASDALEIFDSAKKAASLAKADFDEADGRARELRDRYYAGIYGEIASRLSDNTKCPVCGSTVHPEPAEKLPDSVSSEEVEAGEKEAETARTLWDDAEKDRLSAEKENAAADSALKDAERTKQSAQAVYDAAKTGLIDGIPDKNALEEALRELKKEIRIYNDRLETLSEEYEKAAEELTKLEGKIMTAETEKNKAAASYQTVSGSLQNALSENGYESMDGAKSMLLSAAERNALHERIVRYDSDLEKTASDLTEKKAELEGETEPDPLKFSSRQQAIREESDGFTKRDEALRLNIDRLSSKSRMLRKMSEEYMSTFARAESDLAFARKLRGDTGVGLQRYVLAVMFGQVIAEANKMLGNVHDGRYRLFRTKEGGSGNQHGLELKVYDSWSPESDGRSVAMLSGGEKFLVSLALSIGMSTIAQRSGVQIEALFIDEGFGTLDDDSIGDALDVLNAVSLNCGSIGIISHVRLLEENIHTHLEIVKDRSGSRVKPF